jgi:hypothetical protein
MKKRVKDADVSEPTPLPACPRRNPQLILCLHLPVLIFYYFVFKKEKGGFDCPDNVVRYRRKGERQRRGRG